ncbi:MAG: YIP1 family protein [Chthoniobacterales bacterium]
MAMIHVSRSSAALGVFDEARVREGLQTGEFIGTDLGWTEGMTSWRPSCSELESFRTETPPPPTAAAPPVGSTLATAPAPAPDRAGLPWDNRETSGFLNALFETIAMVLTRPSEAFRVMKRDGGFADPLLYVLILGMLGAVVSFGFSAMMQSLGFMGSREDGMAALLGLGFSSIFVLVLMPVILIVGTFIGAAITHVCLMILGGANQSYETTLRVLSYSSGSASVFQLVPLCGGVIAGVWSIVLNCIGLSRAHETDTWRAVVAVLLPMVVCCGGVALLFFLLIGSIASADWR